MKRFLCLFFLVTAGLLLKGEVRILAANTAYLKDGDIIFETTDTKAASDIRWTEAGFIVRREATGGNPVRDKNYAVLWLKEEYRTKRDNGDGSYYVKFTIPRKKIEKELEEAGILRGKGDILYLNGIFKVIRYGKPDEGYYRTLAGIKGAAAWRNKNDFDELFDIKVKFDDPTPVEARPVETKTKKEGAGEAAPFAVLLAEERGSEAFDAVKGIPGGEPLYCNGWTREYLRSYEYKKISGEKVYPVTVSRTYHLSWTEKRMYTDADGQLKERSVQRSRSQTVSRTVYVKRDYSYWQIEDLYVGIPEQMTVYNKALPGEKVVLEPQGYLSPALEYQRYLTEKNHIKEPEYRKSLKLSPVSLSGGSSAPVVPDENFQGYAQKIVPEIKVRNDRLLFNGDSIMEDSWREKRTSSPAELPEAQIQTGDNVFYKKGLFLPVSLKNGNYTSRGEVVYKTLVHIKDKDKASRAFEIEEINPVFIHTPAVCNGSVENKYRDCQMLFPDRERGALVLGKTFQVALWAKGHHRAIPGYGYQDYSRYIKSRQVKFPFEVIYKGEKQEKNKWLEIGEEEEFYLPTDVEEKKYRIEFRCIAKNAAEGMKEEHWANLSEENYIASDWVDAEVSGQLRDFSIYDISDYPLWQQVFRKEDSLEKTGFSFPVKQMPLQRGSHPLFENKGILKTGYTLRMSCRTIGEMEEEGAYVRIVPRFYHISQDFKERRPVDVYYSETIDGELKQLVKIGGKRDKNNIKGLRLGDSYLSIPKEELKMTAEKKKENLQQFIKKEHKTFTFSNIMLSCHIQMLSAVKGVQKWYFEYYLPSKIYVTEKGFLLEEYRGRNKLNLQERFWIRDGFLVLNFDIETIRKGKRYLSYRNEAMSAKGYRNQWQHEKGEIIEEPLALGDVALFDLKGSAAVDYQSRGTH